MHTHTSTYVLLELSEAAYEEVREKLAKAGYLPNAYIPNPDAPPSPRIVMTGIAVIPEVEIIGDNCTVD